MKKLVLKIGVVASILFSAQSFAQINGITIGPYGATGDDDITITIDVPATCNVPSTESLEGSTQTRLHGGLGYANCTIDFQTLSHTNGWQNVVNASDSDPASWFTLQPNGKWSKTINPRTYFEAPPGETINYLCFVINGGDVGSMWSKKASNTKPSTSECNGDFFVAFPLEGQVTSIADKFAANPLALNLSAFPNPVKGATTFSYNVPSTEKVSIKVYDMLGAEVATVLNEEQTAGKQSVKWNSSSLSTGMYLYTVTVGNRKETKKLVITK